MTDETPRPASRLQRVLAYIIGGLVILSVAAIVAVIMGTWLGAGGDQGAGKGIWPAVFFTPLIGLPVAFVLMIILLVVSLIGRGRQNRETGR